MDEIVERLEGCAKTESQLKRIQEAAKYIKNNWTAAKRRLWRRNGVCACSAEGHVSHVLSSRMSTLALGLEQTGCIKNGKTQRVAL